MPPRFDDQAGGCGGRFSGKLVAAGSGTSLPVENHSAFHTALTQLAQGGMDLLRLETWAGHSDPKITAERYTHFTADDLMGGLDIFNKPKGLIEDGMTPIPVTCLSLTLAQRVPNWHALTPLSH